MKSPNLNQKGMGHLLLILAAIVIVALAFVGWRVMNSDQANNNSNSANQSGEIKSAQDLEKAEKTLNETNLDELDTSELDAAEDELL
jgi:predicted negative regulator of RcsB-dependent stress response